MNMGDSTGMCGVYSKFLATQTAGVGCPPGPSNTWQDDSQHNRTYPPEIRLAEEKTAKTQRQQLVQKTYSSRLIGIHWLIGMDGIHL